MFFYKLHKGIDVGLEEINGFLIIDGLASLVKQGVGFAQKYFRLSGQGHSKIRKCQPKGFL